MCSQVDERLGTGMGSRRGVGALNRQVWQSSQSVHFISVIPTQLTQCSSSFFIVSFLSPTQGNRAFLSVFLGTQVFIIQNCGFGQGVCLAIFLCSGRNSSLCMRSQELCCYGSGSNVFLQCFLCNCIFIQFISQIMKPKVQSPA